MMIRLLYLIILDTVTWSKVVLVRPIIVIDLSSIRELQP
jgi:hypothetical protein